MNHGQKDQPEGQDDQMSGRGPGSGLKGIGKLNWSTARHPATSAHTHGNSAGEQAHAQLMIAPERLLDAIVRTTQTTVCETHVRNDEGVTHETR